MVVSCEIQLENNPEATYYAGQVINGKITLTADKIKKIKAVNLKINGSAYTRWVERHKKTLPRRVGDMCVGKVDYINTVTCLITPKTNEETAVIEPGIHTFSFVCHIPLKCPSSFEGRHGNIRYFMQVSLERPWKFNQNFTKAFTVLGINDLNLINPLLELPVKNDVTKAFCCGPCKSEPLQISAQIPQSGFVCGQLIPVSILVTNNTLAHVNEICVRLVMGVKYFTTNLNRSTSETKTISKLIGDPVLSNSKKQFNYLLPTPATPPTCTTLCSIIQITYNVEVEAKMQGILYRNQVIRIPVTIGNVPLRLDRMIIQNQPMRKQVHLKNEEHMSGKNNSAECITENDNLTRKDNMAPWIAAGNISPPVYMEATHMPHGKLSENEDHEYGEKCFVPKYPVFDLPSHTIEQQSYGSETDGDDVSSMVTNPDKTSKK